MRFMWVWFMYRYSHGIDVIKITADFNLVLWPIYCLCFFRHKLAVMNIIFSRFFKTYLYWISGDYIPFDYGEIWFIVRQMKGKSNKGNTLSKTLTRSTVLRLHAWKNFHLKFCILTFLCLIVYAFNYVYDYYIL